MNKLFAITLLSLIALASATVAPLEESPIDAAEFDEESQAAFPSDDVETASLNEDTKIFSDFCISSRDEIQSYIKSSIDGGVSNVFTAVMTDVNEIGKDILNAEKSAVEAGAAIIKDEVVPTTEEQQPAAKIESEVNENLNRVQALSRLEKLGVAIRGVLSAVVQTASSRFGERVAMLKSMMNADVAKGALESACGAVVGDLARNMETNFNKFKTEVRASASKSSNPKNIYDVINKAKMDNVGCVTLGRLTKLVGFCNIMKMIGPTVFPLLGL